MNFSASIVLSNCESTNRREETIKNLGEFITIDVYGACGSGKIDTHWSDNFGMQHFPSSYQPLGEKYPFLLAFENSHCTDYISERFHIILEV